MKTLVVIALSLFSVAAIAGWPADLAKPVKPHAVSAKNQATPSLNCSNVQQQLLAFQDRFRAASSSCVSGAYDTANVMSSWYGQLRSNEGQTVYIPYGSFNAIGQSANTVANNARIYQSDFDNLSSQLAQIIAAASQCLR